MNKKQFEDLDLQQFQSPKGIKMSTYKELRGLRVKYVPTDTTSPSTAAAGDVWYNTASGQLNAFVARPAWSASASLIVAKEQLAGAGTQSSAFAAGGISGTDVQDKSEEYYGSGWASGGDLNTGRRNVTGAGTQTAGLIFGGGPSAVNSTEEYN